MRLEWWSTPDNMKVLFFGDIVAKIGRRALVEVLPKWLELYKPDAVIGNVENLAHGNGFTRSTLEELQRLGFNGFTSGDHAFSKPEETEMFEDKNFPVCRPANFPESVPGKGYFRIKIGARDLVVINLLGRVFMSDQYDDPFRTIDGILEKFKNDGDVGGVLVDFHAEATSEKVAMGWYLDGRVSAVVGTHTHVATADAQVLPQGTAYITDVGMTGSRDGVIGIDKDIIIKKFLTQMPSKFNPVEDGRCRVQAVLIDMSSQVRANDIKYIYEDINI